MNQQNQIVSHILIGFNNPVIKGFQKSFVLKTAVSQLQEKFVGASFFFCFQRKLQIHEIFSQSTGKIFPENFKVFKHILLGKGKKGFFKKGFFIFFSVHVTAADAGNGTVGGSKLTLDF